MTEQNYYRLTIPAFGEYYEWGETALNAIATTRAAFTQPLGAITARPAVYKEWVYPATAYRNDGTFTGRNE